MGVLHHLCSFRESTYRKSVVLEILCDTFSCYIMTLHLSGILILVAMTNYEKILIYGVTVL